MAVREEREMDGHVPAPPQSPDRVSAELRCGSQTDGPTPKGSWSSWNPCLGAEHDDAPSGSQASRRLPKESARTLAAVADSSDETPWQAAVAPRKRRRWPAGRR